MSGVKYNKSISYKFLLGLFTRISAESHSDTAETALYPLGESIAYVTEVPGKPGEYRAVIYIRPIYQLEDLRIAMRTVFNLPDPQLLIKKSDK